MIWSEKNVAVTGLCEWCDHRPRHAVHVDHRHRGAMDAPITGELFADGGNPLKFFSSKCLEYIAAMAGEDAHQAFVDVIPHDLAGRILAAIRAVILPEPVAFYAIAVADGFVLFRRFITKFGGFVEKAGGVEPLDILRVMEADVRMGGNHDVDGPMAWLGPCAFVLPQAISILIQKLPTDMRQVFLWGVQQCPLMEMS